MFPIFCPCQDLECNSYLHHQRTRCCNHQSSCLLSGLRQRSAFLLHSMLERFLTTRKEIDFFFCEGQICHLGGHLRSSFSCQTVISFYGSVMPLLLNGHHCAVGKWNNNFNMEKRGRGKKLKLSSYNHRSIFSCQIGRLSWHDCFSESDCTWWHWFPRKWSKWSHTFWGSGTP